MELLHYTDLFYCYEDRGVLFGPNGHGFQIPSEMQDPVYCIQISKTNYLILSRVLLFESDKMSRLGDIRHSSNELPANFMQ